TKKPEFSGFLNLKESFKYYVADQKILNFSAYTRFLLWPPHASFHAVHGQSVQSRFLPQVPDVHAHFLMRITCSGPQSGCDLWQNQKSSQDFLHNVRHSAALQSLDASLFQRAPDFVR